MCLNNSQYRIQAGGPGGRPADVCLKVLDIRVDFCLLQV